MAAKGAREPITLECTECKEEIICLKKIKETIQIEWN